ncbi:MAG: response regulator [Phycisphaerae bacterium]|nr:response regulator [Phycisphaerae bacterium]
MNEAKERIFVIDDEPEVLKSIEATLCSFGYEIDCFDDPQQLFEMLKERVCDLLIVDVNMPQINGFDLVEKIRKEFPLLGIIMVTAYGDIPMAIRAMRKGAVNFLEKPLHREQFANAVQDALQQKRSIATTDGGTLTAVQEKILDMIVDGKSNKQIAVIMHRSVRTIEWHRNNIMRKLNANNVVDLIKAAVGAVQS